MPKFEHRDIPVSWTPGKFSVPYTQSTLRAETLSSIAQKLILDGRAITEKEALSMAQELMNKVKDKATRK